VVSFLLDTERLVVATLLDSSLQRFAHVVFLSLFCQFTVVVACAWVGFFQAVDHSFIPVDHTLQDACWTRALQVRDIDIRSIYYVFSVQEKFCVRNQVISKQDFTVDLCCKAE